MAEPSRLSRADFDALVRRAGLTFDDTKADELYRAYASLETLLARINEPLPLEAEPAVIFTLDGEAP
ncbi:MAG TPA: hypothetical protein VL993_09530 [Stellaceae bacterium]|nr:hypothetical protein [Stellaceae bacterium]